MQEYAVALDLRLPSVLCRTFNPYAQDRTDTISNNGTEANWLDSKHDIGFSIYLKSNH